MTGRLTTISTAAMLLLTMSVGSRAAVSLVEPNTALVSIAGTEIGGAASPAISGDGRFVIFIDDQERLDEGHDGLKNVFVRDMRADTATRVTLGSAVRGSVTAFDVTISQDAEWLGILAVDFDSGEVVSPALYVVSRRTGAARKIAPAAAAAFSGDGRYIAILSQSRLTPDDHDDESDIIVYDQVTGTYDRVTVKTEAATGGGQRVRLTRRNQCRRPRRGVSWMFRTVCATRRERRLRRVRERPRRAGGAARQRQ